MLRITRCIGAEGELSLRLEGRLAASSLEILAGILAAYPSSAVALDLSELHALDKPVLAWLEARVASGTRVSGATPFLARVLAVRG
jgi:hypothetical protein